MHEVQPVALVVATKVPPEHKVHTEAPAAEYEPAAQPEQAVEPVAAWNTPAAQEEQTPAPAAE